MVKLDVTGVEELISERDILQCDREKLSNFLTKHYPTEKHRDPTNLAIEKLEKFIKFQEIRSKHAEETHNKHEQRLDDLMDCMKKLAENSDKIVYRLEFLKPKLEDTLKSQKGG